MHVHLVDGTYELFRHFYAVPAAADVNGGKSAQAYFEGQCRSMGSPDRFGPRNVGENSERWCADWARL
jgi:hypothetical protein